MIAEDGAIKPKAEWSRISNGRDIKFSGLRARDSVVVNKSKETRRYKSDLYVFCFEHEKEHDHWNALDLSQWELYIVTCKDLSVINTSSISLRKLRELQEPISAQEFRRAFEQAVSQFRGLAQAAALS